MSDVGAEIRTGEAGVTRVASDADLTQGQLFRLRFRRHRLAMVGLWMVVGAILTAAFAEFVAPHGPRTVNSSYQYAAPQLPRFIDEDGTFHLVPFVHPMTRTFDVRTGQRTWTVDTGTRHHLGLLVRGDPYRMWGLFESNVRLFGTRDGKWYPLGTDRLGRDSLSRIIHGTRISLSVGLAGVAISLVLGVLIGGAAGYHRGWVDTLVQRLTEVLIAIPSLPLWMALSAALPPWWSPVWVYLAITVILSTMGWTGIAREVRGRFLSLREEDFVTAARLQNCSEWRIITRYMLPSMTSHIIASASLAIPVMILAETALSFLGIGLRPPAISWGVLMQEAQNIHSVALYPWLLAPGVFVILAVLAFNFVGDGLRDAADPHGRHV